LRIRYAVRIKWSGKQGTLIIKYEDNRWFAYVLITVGEKPARSNPRGYVKGVYDRCKSRSPRARIRRLLMLV
jgi:putative transposase